MISWRGLCAASPRSGSWEAIDSSAARALARSHLSPPPPLMQINSNSLQPLHNIFMRRAARRFTNAKVIRANTRSRPERFGNTFRAFGASERIIGLGNKQIFAHHSFMRESNSKHTRAGSGNRRNCFKFRLPDDWKLCVESVGPFGG